MKVLVNIPLKHSRLYEDNFDEDTIPNVGENFDDVYIVARKTIDGNICILDLKKIKDHIKE